MTKNSENNNPSPEITNAQASPVQGPSNDQTK